MPLDLGLKPITIPKIPVQPKQPAQPSYQLAPDQTVGGLKIYDPEKKKAEDIANKEIDFDFDKKMEIFRSTMKENALRDLPAEILQQTINGPAVINEFLELGKELQKVSDTQLGPASKFQQNIITKVPFGIGEGLSQKAFGDKYALEKKIGQVAKNWGRLMEGGKLTDADYLTYLKLFVDVNEPKALRWYGYQNALRALIMKHNTNLAAAKALNLNTGKMQPIELPQQPALPSVFTDTIQLKVNKQYEDMSPEQRGSTTGDILDYINKQTIDPYNYFIQDSKQVDKKSTGGKTGGIKGSIKLTPNELKALPDSLIIKILEQNE